MTTKEFSWKSREGLKIYAAEWPVASAKAVVGLVHGVGEHCRRYDHLAAFLQKHDVAMLGYDRQGHGQSEGKPGYAARFSLYYEEVAALLIECERRYPDRPVYLYGHSLGGNLVLNYIIRRNPDLAGAILSAPFIQLGFPPNQASILLGKMMRKIYPSFSQSNQLNLPKLSRDPAVIEAYKADPLVHDRVTARTGLDTLESGDYLHNYQGEINIPILLMHGSADEITSHGATAAFAKRVEGPDISFQSWPDFYHELHNEPEKKEVFDFVWSWISARLGTTNAQRKLKSV